MQGFEISRDLLLECEGDGFRPLPPGSQGQTNPGERDLAAGYGHHHAARGGMACDGRERIMTDPAAAVSLGVENPPIRSICVLF
jgi:hypothetical protein